MCVSADPRTNASGHCLIVASVLAKLHCHELSNRWGAAVQFLGVHVQDCCHNSDLPRSTQIYPDMLFINVARDPIYHQQVIHEIDTCLNNVVAQGPAGGSESGYQVSRSCADHAL